MKLPFLLLGALVFIISACTAPKALQFNPSWEAGNTFAYRIAEETDTDVTVMGQRQKTGQRQEMQFTYKVQQVDEQGNTELEVTLTALKVEQLSGGMGIDFDSEEEDKQGPLDKIYRAMLNQPMSMTVDSKGKVVAFSGADAIVEKMFGEIDVPGMEMMLEAMKVQFGGHMFREKAGIFSIYTPEAKLKVGDSWNIQDTSEASFGLISNSRVLLKQRKDGKAILDISGTLSYDPDAEPVDMGMMRIRYDMKGTQSGVIVLDETTGRVLRSDVDQDLSGKMYVSSDMIGDKESDIKMHTNTVVERIGK